MNGTWIKQRLGNERGAVARMAEAIGMEANKLSKVISGTRDLTPDETIAVLIYFGILTPAMLEPGYLGHRIELLPQPQHQVVARLVDTLLAELGVPKP